MTDIVERLHKIADASRREDGSDTPLGEHCREAADEIERLREGLRPFACVAALDICSTETDSDVFRPFYKSRARAQPLTVGDLRRARAALEEQL